MIKPEYNLILSIKLKVIEYYSLKLELMVHFMLRQLFYLNESNYLQINYNKSLVLLFFILFQCRSFVCRFLTHVEVRMKNGSLCSIKYFYTEKLLLFI